MKRLAGLIAALLLSAGAYAADTKISDLPAGGPMQDADKFPIARGAANYSILGSALCRVTNCVMMAPLLFEGATDNANETSLTVVDPTADRTITLPDASGTVAVVASSTGGFLTDTTGSMNWTSRCLAAGTETAIANACGSGGNPIVNQDTSITFIRSQGTAAPPATCTAQMEWYIKTDTGGLYFCRATNIWDLIHTSSVNLWTTRQTFGTSVDAANAIDLNETPGAITFEGGSAETSEMRLVSANITADRTITLPDLSGTVAIASGAQTFAGIQTFSSTASFTAGLTSDSNIGVRSGGNAVGAIVGSGASTGFPPVLATINTQSNTWNLQELADIAFDYGSGACGGAQCTDPTLVGRSHNQSQTEWWSVKHNGTDMVLAAGAGGLDMSGIAGAHKLNRTITAGGTTGAQTISKNSGTVNFAAGATTLVVTNTLVTSTTIVLGVRRTADTTCFLASVESGSGSFTIRMTAACAAETSVGFVVYN